MPTGIYKRTKNAWNKGLPFSLEVRKKMSLSKIGVKRPPFTEETKRKMSVSQRKRTMPEYVKLKISGEKSHLWNGGTSYEDYAIEWTNRLKLSIRERDNFTCQVCGKIEEERSHDVHHIDYNKKNCSNLNLVTLCRKCHMRTNFKREAWIRFFNKPNEKET